MKSDRERNCILVTGGAGYIGSHACKALAKAGYTPVSYDNLVYGHRWAVRWGPLEIGDISDRRRLDYVISRYSPKAVIHFAAFAYVGESVQDPGKYYRNNVVGTLTLLEALRDHCVNQLILSSSCATYGIPLQIPITEGHPQLPVSPYGASKLMTERILQDFGAAHGFRFIILRYFNAAGADPDGETGETHDPETHLIPLILDVAIGKQEEITVYGNDYDTQDGTCVRDYIHVTDLADAHVLALGALERGAGSAAYNLGNGEGHSVEEVVDLAKRVTGCQIPVRIGPRRMGDPPRLVGDARKIKTTLCWTPKHSSIEEIVETAWRWHVKKGEKADDFCGLYKTGQ